MHCLLYRDEKLLAQGLDPRQFKDPEDGKQQEIKLVFPPLPEFSGGTASPSEQTPVRTKSAIAKKAPSEYLQRTGEPMVERTDAQLEEVNDRDLPSSTPAPPPLIVPIVTHAKGSTEGQSAPTLEVSVLNVFTS